MSDDDLRDAVFEALENAKKNGWDWTIIKAEYEVIAFDLHTYDSDLEDVAPEALIPYIKEWLRR